jgi:hypothetical protein
MAILAKIRAGVVSALTAIAPFQYKAMKVHASGADTTGM